MPVCKLLITSLGLLMTYNAVAVSKVKMKFSIVNEMGDKLKGATIILYKDNQKHVVKENAPASMSLSLDFEHHYTIEITKASFVTKRISVDTHIGENPLIYNKFSFVVELERKSKYSLLPEADQVLDYPAAMVQYDIEEGTFEYSKPYLHNTLQHVARLKQSVYQAGTEAEASRKGARND